MPSTIMIVGNGSVPKGAASIIDKSDLVIRFNDCRTLGQAGTRTDVVAVCNTGRPARAMIEEPRWAENAAVLQSRAIWCVRDSGKFRELRDILSESNPELDDFCDDRTEAFSSFAAKSGKSFASIPRRHHDWLDRELSALGATRYTVPSSGLIVIAYVLEDIAADDDIVILTGFDHQGWQGHPFTAERQLTEKLITMGKLSRLAMPVAGTG